jgi:hypothetical protein
MSYPPPPPPVYRPRAVNPRVNPGGLNRTFFEKNPQISVAERLPYPEYRYTKYFWLVNLNQACYTKQQSEYLVGVLRKAVLKVFTRGSVVAFAHPNHQWDRRYIGNNELKLAIEVGTKKGRVHAHLIQEIKHRSLINIDPQDVKREINAVMGQLTGGRIQNAFVSRTVHPSSKPLEEYVDKDNHSWRDDNASAHGIFSYTLTKNVDSPLWDVSETVVRPIDLSVPASYTVGESTPFSSSSTSATSSQYVANQPSRRPWEATSSTDEDFLIPASSSYRR